MRTSPPCPPLALALLAMVWTAGCGNRDAPTRYAVIGRSLDWQPAGPAQSAREPLSLSWDFESEEGGWKPPGSTHGERAAGSWKLTGRPFADLVGPLAGQVDPEVHHWLSVRLAARDAVSLSVHWRDRGQRFDPARRTSPMPLESDGEQHTYLMRIASFRGIREASDAEDGVEQFRLRFTAGEGQQAQVEVDQVALLSDFEDPLQRGFQQGRLSRAGIYRDGVALHAPVAVAADLPVQPGDRLRFALAVVGTGAPVMVHVTERDGLLASRDIRVDPGAPWSEQDMDLTPAAAGDGIARLVFTCDDNRAVVLLGSVLHLRPETTRLPSVVLYVEDTLRADRLGTYGYGQDTDPALRAIAQQGVLFERVYATSSWTRPSIASLLTSLLPVAHGTRTHNQRIPEDLTTLAEALADAGYVTVSFVTNYHAGAWAGLDQGFDVHAEPRSHGATRLRSTLTSTVLRRPVAGALERWRDTRLFLFAHSLDPHAPYEPDRDDLAPFLKTAAARPIPDVRDKARYERSSLHYDAEVRHNDGELARVDQVLASLGLTRETLLVFVSDHGEAFAEHGAWEHRKSLYQEEVVVPWVMRLPGRIPAGTRVEQAVSLIDLSPTLLGLLGLDRPDTWSGQDLSEACLGTPPRRQRDPRPLFMDVIHSEPQRGAREELAVVLSETKLLASVHEGQLSATELYRLADDPAETTNLLGNPQHQPAVDAMIEMLRQMLAQGPALPDADTQAAGMDPQLREWMQQMGYLR